MRTFKLNSNLNEKNVTENKNLWKTVTPLLSTTLHKIAFDKNIILFDGDELIDTNIEAAQLLKMFF